MSDNQPHSPGQHVRRRHFVDRDVQGRLIAGLILIEVLLFAAAMWIVYQEMQTAIDQELYRVHQIAARSAPVLLYALYHTVPWIVIVNLLVLVAIDRVWGRYVNIVISKLRRSAQHVAALDLRGQLYDTEHEVLRQAKHWIDSEHSRYRQLRQLVQALPDSLDAMDYSARPQLIEQLRHIREQMS
jgi:HAMP domain-containing protein